MNRRLLAAPAGGLILGLIVIAIAVATDASEAAVGVAISLAALGVVALAVWSVLSDEPHSQN